MADPTLVRTYRHDDGTDCTPDCPMYGDNLLEDNSVETYPNPEPGDWEWTGTVEHYGVDYQVSVTKIGGGTVGNRYAGSWYVKVVSALKPNHVLINDMLTTGMHYSHASVGAQAVWFVPEQV